MLPRSMEFSSLVKWVPSFIINRHHFLTSKLIVLLMISNLNPWWWFCILVILVIIVIIVIILIIFIIIQCEGEPRQGRWSASQDVDGQGRPYNSWVSQTKNTFWIFTTLVLHMLSEWVKQKIHFEFSQEWVSRTKSRFVFESLQCIQLKLNHLLKAFMSNQFCVSWVFQRNISWIFLIRGSLEKVHCQPDVDSFLSNGYYRFQIDI